MKNIVRDLCLFFIIWIIYAGGRLLLFALFAPLGTVPTLHWVKTSARFDIMVSAYFILPTLALTGVSAFAKLRFDSVKKAYFLFAVFISILIAGLNVAFFKEYHSQYNYWIQGLFFDDRAAIFSTVWKMYNLPLIAMGLIALLFIAALAVRHLFRMTERLSAPKIFNLLGIRIACALIAAFVCVVLLRGGKISGRPLQMQDSIVSGSDFLNNLVPSSAYCIKYELKRCVEVHFDRTAINEKELRSYAAEIFGSEGDGNLAEILGKTSQGSPLSQAPDHIFFIVCESYSAWPTFDQFKKYKLMPEFMRMSKDGIFSTNMLAVSNATMSTMCSIVSGVPFAGILNQALYRNAENAFSLAGYMRRLGYETNFFYAGHLGWHEIGNFTKGNGFDRSFGGEAFLESFRYLEWGIRDDELFNGVYNTEFKKPSFNLILTASNHQPFDVDLEAFGCPNPLDNEKARQTNHMWFSDMQIAGFVEKISAKYPNSIVVVTGDHPSRVFPLGEEVSANAQMLVPFLIAGKPVSDANLAMEIPSASHMDIIPTLIELVAPAGFEYCAWGENLLGKPKRVLLNYYCIFKDGKLVLTDSLECDGETKEFVRKYMELAYWCARRGLRLPASNE